LSIIYIVGVIDGVRQFWGCGAAPMPIYSVIVYREQPIVSGFVYLFALSYIIKSSNHDVTEIFLMITWKTQNTTLSEEFLLGETGVPGENHRPTQVTDKVYHIMLYTSPWFELSTSVVIGTDCRGSYYHWL